MNHSNNSELNLIDTKFSNLQSNFIANPYPSLIERKRVLSKIKMIILNNENKFYEALEKDFRRRCKLDSLVGDIISVVTMINYLLANLRKWMKSEPRKIQLAVFPGKVSVVYQPLGVIGIIGPYNFPMNLT